MALTDIKVRTAKPTDKQYKLTDGNGRWSIVGVEFLQGALFDYKSNK